MKSTQKRTLCVYTIVNRAAMEKALEGDGTGVFEEGKRWTTAAAHLTAQGEQTYPLLLADAASIQGIQWVAHMTAIELLPTGTRVHFSALAELTTAFSLSYLSKSSDSEPLSENYIRPYVPCFIQDECKAFVLKILEVERGANGDHLGDIETKTVADYANALVEIEPVITPKQRLMLVAHAKAPGQRITARKLADVAGFQSHGMANIQYGILGRKFADAFGVYGLPLQTQAIAFSDGHRDSDGHYVWKLREQLLEALFQAGWLTRPKIQDMLKEAASREIDADPRCHSIPETTREALIDARLGQGAYRSNLLRLWGSQCALTGCAVSEVLVASHAKSWKASSNEERLDPFNGLLLAAQVDKLFDRGLISFAPDGALLVNESVDAADLSSMGMARNTRLRFVRKEHLPYLAAHRAKYVFN